MGTLGTNGLKKNSIFVVIDLGEKVQMSRLVYWANFGNSYYLDKLILHYYTKDVEFNKDAPNASDFK